MSATYHGEKPVTKPDMDMAKDHLTNTIALKQTELALNKSKIKDHQQAIASTTNPKSISYNKQHITGHENDNKTIQATIAEREASMKTLSNLQPVYGKVNGDTNMASPINKTGTTQKTGSYKGQSNAPGGGGRFKQMTDSGVSPALASYIGRKKFGASTMAKMAAKGKS